MTDKVQKIREEIEKLKLCTMDEHMKFYSDAAEAEYNALCEVEKIIDSLQEEPIFKVGDTIQKKDDNSIRYSIINKTSDGYRALRGLSDTIVIWFSEQDQWELVEEPASKVWHDASEEPNINSMIIYKCNGCTPDIGRFIGVVGIEVHFSWEIFKYPQSIIINNIEKWAYIDDIINL